MRTIVYVDGFNLYYRMLKKSAFKWLNLHDLSKAALPQINQIIAVNYYTARVSGRVDPLAPARQHAYLCALKTVQNLNTYFGRFQVHDTSMYLSKPLEFQPAVTVINPTPKFAKVVKTEEKGSDVNLGVHLVRDGFIGKYDHAVVITNDTDLEEPIKIVRKELHLPVTLLSPVQKPAASLTANVSDVIHLTTAHLASSQFPQVVIDQNGKSYTKPLTW